MNTRSLLNASLLAAFGIGIAALPSAAQGPGPGGSGMGMGPCGGPGTMMLEWLDENDDGKVTLEEFRAAHDERFAAMDANGDGKVTLEEFQSPPKPPKQTRLQRMFQRVDANGDGAIGREEFEERFTARFERFDTNGDKVITVEEIQLVKPQWRGPEMSPGGGPGPGPGRTQP